MGITLIFKRYLLLFTLFLIPFKRWFILSVGLRYFINLRLDGAIASLAYLCCTTGLSLLYNINFTYDTAKVRGEVIKVKCFGAFKVLISHFFSLLYV